MKKLEREIQKKEEQIEKAESELAEMDKIMAKQGTQTDDWYWSYGKKKESIQNLMNEWGELQEKLESVMSGAKN